MNEEKMTTRTVIELLKFLSKEEKFAETEKLLGTQSVSQVKDVLTDLSTKLEKELSEENERTMNASEEEGLSTLTKEVLSKLSKQEEELLFRSFGLVEE